MILNNYALMGFFIPISFYEKFQVRAIVELVTFPLEGFSQFYNKNMWHELYSAGHNSLQ